MFGLRLGLAALTLLIALVSLAAASPFAIPCEQVTEADRQLGQRAATRACLTATTLNTTTTSSTTSSTPTSTPTSSTSITTTSSFFPVSSPATPSSVPPPPANSTTNPGSTQPPSPSTSNSPAPSHPASVPPSGTSSPFSLGSTPSTPSWSPSYPPSSSASASPPPSSSSSGTPTAPPISSYPALSSVPLFTGTGISPTETPGCLDGAYILSIRGTTEEFEGGGLVMAVAKQIWEKLGGKGHSEIVNVPYPASFFPGEGKDKHGKEVTKEAYWDSVRDGVKEAEDLIIAFVDKSLKNKCEKIQVVMVGFSQGAHVITDVLAGGPYVKAPRIHTGYGKYISAACGFGDPTFTVNVEPIDQGTNKDGPRSGIFKRTGKSLEFLIEHYSKRLRSYCALDDRYCADTPLNDKVHGMEIAMYGGQCVEFVTGLVAAPKKKLLKPRVADLVPKPLEEMVERALSQ